MFSDFFWYRMSLTLWHDLLMLVINRSDKENGGTACTTVFILTTSDKENNGTACITVFI